MTNDLLFSSVYNRALDEFSQEGRQVHCALLLKYYLEFKPDKGIAYILYSNALFDLGRLQIAYNTLLSHINVIPEKILCHAFALLGEISQEMGFFKQAEKHLRKALELAKPSDNISWIFLGANLAVQGAFEEALECHQKAIDPNVSKDQEQEARLNMGYILRTQGKYKEAKSELLKAIEIDENYAKAIYELKNLDELENISHLCQQLEELITLSEDNEVKNERNEFLNSINNNIQKFFYEEKHILVIELGRRYCQLRTKDWKCWAFLGDSLRILGCPTESLQALKVGLDLAPESEKAWVCCLIAHLQISYFSREEGEKWYKRSVEIYNGSWGWLWLERGKNLSKSGKHEASLRCYQKALGYPLEIKLQKSVLFETGCVLRGEENFEEAQKQFLEILKIDPNEQSAKIALKGLEGIKTTLQYCNKLQVLKKE